MSSDMKTGSNLTFTGNVLHLAAPYEIANSGYKKGAQFFLHIPKTGGTSVHFSLQGAFQAESADGKIPYTRFRVERIAGQSPVMISPQWRGSWPVISALDNKATIKADFNFFSAHCAFGFDQLLGIEGGQYFTLVRDPIEREISAFNFLHQKGYLARDASLSNMISSGALLDNPQVRLIAGHDFMTGECTQKTYDVAVRNIETYFLLAAPSSETHSVIKTLLGLYNLPPVAYVKSQVTGVKLIEAGGDDLKDQLASYHAYDRILHNYVSGKWSAWAKENLAGERVIGQNEKVVVIGPEYFEERRPRIMSYRDLPQTLDDNDLKNTHTLDL